MQGRSLVVLMLLTAVGCNKKASAPAHQDPAPAARDANATNALAPDATAAALAPPLDAATAPASTAKLEPAEPRARATLDAQLATFPADHAAFAATFTPKAIAMAPTPLEVALPESQFATTVPRMLGHKTLEGRKATKIVAGSAPGMIWFAAELELDISGEGSRGKQKVRVLELLDGGSGWKAATATFGDTTNRIPAYRSVAPPPVTAPAGPLAKLLLSPGAAAAALADDPNVVVQGTEEKEYAVGPAAAKALLGRWSKLELAFDRDMVLEVRTKDWGFALGNVNLPNPEGRNPFRMGGLLIAVPDGESWSVVAVHYLPL